jgi:3-oxoadipate CoA-transferase beta subunit
MDLVAGVKRIFVITQHTTKRGLPKIINDCTFPLTGKNVVERIYTNLAIIDVKEDGLFIKELAPNVDFDFVQKYTEATLFQYEKNKRQL